MLGPTKLLALQNQRLAITFVFGLLWGALWLLRKKGASGSVLTKRRSERGLLESVAKLSLSGQHSVHVVRVGDRELVLGVYGSGVTLLADLDRGENRGRSVGGGGL